MNKILKRILGGLLVVFVFTLSACDVATDAVQSVNDSYSQEETLTESTSQYDEPDSIPTYTETYSAQQNSYDSDVDYYTNVDGNQVQSPTYYNSQPSGATAICDDGTYSFSQHRSGTCSGHGGVAQWL